MRGDLVNLSIKTFTKQCSGLIVKCLETRTTHILTLCVIKTKLVEIY